MSTQKGRRNERKAREAYERAGWWVYSPENASYGDNDLWNLFDLACIDVMRSVIALVQVKSNRAQGVRQWCNDTRPFDAVSGVQCQFLVRHDREGWQAIEPLRDGRGSYKTVYDEREDERVDPNRTGKWTIGDGLTEWLS